MPMFVPPVADERTGLLAYLEQQRQHIRNAVAGLREQDARAVPTASSMSLAALLKHVVHTERRWVVAALAGRTEGLWPVADWTAEWQLTDEDTVDGLLAAYQAVTEETAAVVADIEDLGQPCALPDTAHWSARWVLLHLIEETACHAGHADILRESLDGATAAELGQPT